MICGTRRMPSLIKVMRQNGQKAAKEWEKYLGVYERVYPQNRFGDIFHIMAFVIDEYPTVFWLWFWKYHFNTLHDDFYVFLNQTVVPSCYRHNLSRHKNFSSIALQKVINTLPAEGPFGYLFSLNTKAVKEALIATGMELVPKGEWISRDSYMSFQENSTQLHTPGVVYF